MLRIEVIPLQAMDNGHPTFSTVCTVLVELIDVNENVHAPVFSDIAHEASVYGELLCFRCFEIEGISDCQ